MTVPKAPVIGQPVWPVVGVRKVVHTHGGKSFGASRASGDRQHAGIDILAPEGAQVVAVDDGEVIATQGFNGPRAHALLLQLDSGPVVLYGEVLPGSWNQFGVSVGSRVARGQPIATIGVNPGGSTMLHFEMYRGGTRTNQRWYHGQPPPPALYDPTAYLAAAARGELEEQDTGPDHGHDHDPVLPPGPAIPDPPPMVRPPIPDPPPSVVPPSIVPPVKVPIGWTGGLVALGLLVWLASQGRGRRGY